MEQLTPSEWVQEQLKRAPAFALATGIVTGLLVVSAFVEYLPRAARGAVLRPVEADLGEPERERIREFEREIPLLKRRKVIPTRDDPRADPHAVPSVDAPTLPSEDLDAHLSEDRFSDLAEPTTRFPLTRKLAIIAPEGTGGFRGTYRYRDPTGMRRAKHRWKISSKTFKAIRAGLNWLQRVQDKKTGGWEVGRWGGGQVKSNAGVSGLALLAFLGFGCTDSHRQYGPTVRKAMQYLISRQQSDGPDRGSFGERMYSQAICTMSLCEAYSLRQAERRCDTLQRALRTAAQNGIDYILSKQPSYGGFSYRGSGNDVSVTGWQVMAIKSGLVAGIDVPSSARERTEHFLRLCLSRDYATPYRFRPAGGTTGGTPRMTAVSLACRLFMGHPRSARDCVGQTRWLTRDNTHLKTARRAGDLYYIYYMSLAMYQVGGEHWETWKDTFDAALRARQVETGPDKGSWPVEGTSYGRHGGRVYTTAMALLSLEVYFRFLPMYGARR